MCNLSQCGFKTLTMAVSPNTEFEFAVRCDACAALLVARYHRNTPPRVYGRTVSALFAKDGETYPNITAVSLRRLLACSDAFKIDGFDGSFQTGWIIATIEMFSCNIIEWHCIGRWEV